MPDPIKLSSGSVLLNLACSNYPDFSMLTGAYYWMAGASSSGKTFWTLQHLAEASINPAFDDYDLIHDDTEGGAMMDIERFFGKRLAERIELPHTFSGEPSSSRTVQDFYYGLSNRFEAIEKGKGRRFIYLLDSMDNLRTEESDEKFEEMRDGKDTGDYQLAKAKWNSSRLPEVVYNLGKHNCLLIIVSQIRDNINAKMFQKKQLVSGGHALKFNATWQLWSSLGKEIKKTVHGNDRQVGITSRISVEKNRLAGKEWVIELPIYWSHGIDDLGGCLDFLIEEKKIKNDKGKLIAPDFDFTGRYDDLIQKIQTENLQRQLRAVVVETWREVEQLCAVPLARKYE